MKPSPPPIHSILSVPPIILTGLLFLVLSATTTKTVAESGSWPQWRGPTRDGQVTGPAWPQDLDEARLQLQWEVPLGPSYSGPIVVGDRVFTTETVDKEREVVSAFDRQQGKLLWRTEWDGAMKVPFFANKNGSWIRSTPACDGKRLYVAGIRDTLACLDVEDGSVVWRVDFVEKLGTSLPSFGCVCSPLVADGAVYMQAGASVVRMNADTGEIVWRAMAAKGGMMDSAFSSPIIATLGGQPQLVIQTREELAGLDLEMGAVLWQQPVKAYRGMNILTPVVQGDLVLTSTYGGRTLGFRVTREGDEFRVEQAWQHKSQGYMSTPVIVDNHLYHHLRSQRVMCVDVFTGEERWTSDRSFGTYWSLVAQDNRILALDQDGELFLLKATPTAFEEIDSRPVSDSDTWAHLAVAGDQLFIRSLNGLASWGWREPEIE
jgi:outer membrane protein assembly factor BamB